MKKTKAIAIGLLALSIASCHRKPHNHPGLDTYSDDPSYYIDDGTGYHHGGAYPMWIYWNYGLYSNGGVAYYPSYVYHSHTPGTRVGSGGFRSTSLGRSTSVSRSSIGRGGFGSSGSHAGA